MQLRLEEELDYRIEASNTRVMGEIFRGHPFIRIPDVHHLLSGQRVIVTEWLDGQPLREAYTAEESERNRIAEILFRFYCGTTYLAGFFNSDPPAASRCGSPRTWCSSVTASTPAPQTSNPSCRCRPRTGPSCSTWR
ncbi:hypothetical protein GZH49_25090 [Nocardia terpenica]